MARSRAAAVEPQRAAARAGCSPKVTRRAHSSRSGDDAAPLVGLVILLVGSSAAGSSTVSWRRGPEASASRVVRRGLGSGQLRKAWRRTDRGASCSTAVRTGPAPRGGSMRSCAGDASRESGLVRRVVNGSPARTLTSRETRVPSADVARRKLGRGFRPGSRRAWASGRRGSPQPGRCVPAGAALRRVAGGRRADPRRLSR